jgi:hypothetical protein
MLISSPPAILILHLKRFQMCYSTTRKMTRDVSFQWVLDIAPYCSVKCQVSYNTNIYLNILQTLIFNWFIYLEQVKPRSKPNIIFAVWCSGT